MFFFKIQNRLHSVCWAFENNLNKEGCNWFEKSLRKLRGWHLFQLIKSHPSVPIYFLSIDDAFGCETRYGNKESRTMTTQPSYDQTRIQFFTCFLAKFTNGG